MKNIYANAIKEGDRVETLFLVTKKDSGVSKAGKTYLALKLRDSTGELSGRIWDDAESFKDVFKKDDIVSVKGTAVRYQNNIQLNISDIKKYAEGKFSVKDFLPTSKYSIEEMTIELDAVIFGIKDVHIKRLLMEIFKDKTVRERFVTAPAAKAMHHPYIGGLLEHTLSLLRLGKGVAKNYDGINEDLVMAGLMLHDIGKIREFSLEKTLDYTDEGRLLGHITMGVELVESKIKELSDFPPTLAIVLKHIILSHHGYLEFGSPKVPMTIEAMMVYYLDDLDAKINSMQALVKSALPKADGETDGNWTEYQKSLDRYVYKGVYAGEDAKKGSDEESGDRRSSAPSAPSALGGAGGADGEELKLFK